MPYVLPNYSSSQNQGLGPVQAPSSSDTPMASVQPGYSNLFSAPLGSAKTNTNNSTPNSSLPQHLVGGRNHSSGSNGTTPSPIPLGASGGYTDYSDRDRERERERDRDDSDFTK